MLTNLSIHKDYIPKKRNRKDGFFITISGNVGAGKSTFTKIIGKALDFNTSFEKVVDNPYLKDFYKDQTKWSFHLQTYFLSQRFQDQKKIGELNQNHIQDRSIYEDVEIFAKSLYDNKKMSEKDYNTYSELFYCMMTPYLLKPDLMIFLDGSIETILQRIELRGREMEKKVPKDYWLDLHLRYQNWIKNYNHSPVLIINIDEVDLVNKPEQVQFITKTVREFMLKESRTIAG